MTNTNTNATANANANRDKEAHMLLARCLSDCRYFPRKWEQE